LSAQHPDQTRHGIRSNSREHTLSGRVPGTSLNGPFPQGFALVNAGLGRPLEEESPGKRQEGDDGAEDEKTFLH
jgi:hypothetical protein